MHLPLSLLQFQLIFNVVVFFHFICVVLLMLLVLSASAFSLCHLLLITLTQTLIIPEITITKNHQKLFKIWHQKQSQNVLMRQRLLLRSHIQPGGYLQLFPCCDFSSFVFFVSSHCLPYVADSRPFCLLTRPLEGWLFVRAQGQHLKG